MAGVTGWWAETFIETTGATLTLTGGRPQITATQDNHISPSPAVITVTGGRPSVDGPPIQPTPAHLTITGGEPIIRVGNVVAPTAAGLTITGGTPSIVQSQNNIVSPAGASVTITGGRPVVTTGPIVTPTAAAVTVTGGTPSLAAQIAPTPATVTITGGRPSIDVRYPPPAASLTITGGRPVIDTRVAPAGASVTITGGTPVVTTIHTVSFVGANGNASSSVTIPTHQVGDLIVLFAYNPFSTSAPTKPSAGGTVPNYTYIDNANSGSGSGCATAYFKATATNTTSGSWGSASHMIAVVIRDQNASSPIGGHAQAAGTGASSTAPSVTLTHTDGSSVLLHFHGHASLGASGWDAAPAGYTRQASSGSAFGSASAFNTKNVTTTDGSVAQTGGQSGQNYAAATVEIIN